MAEVTEHPRHNLSSARSSHFANYLRCTDFVGVVQEASWSCSGWLPVQKLPSFRSVISPFLLVSSFYKVWTISKVIGVLLVSLAPQGVTLELVLLFALSVSSACSLNPQQELRALITSSVCVYILRRAVNNFKCNDRYPVEPLLITRVNPQTLT